MDNPWIKLIEFLDRHPVAFVSVLLVAGGALLVFGIPLPQSKRRQTAEGIETTWSLAGGIPGIGRGLVELAKAIVESSKTNAIEREASRSAHTLELQAHKAAIDALRTEQDRTNGTLEKLVHDVHGIANDLHVVVGEFKRMVEKRRDERVSAPHDRASQTSCETPQANGQRSSIQSSPSLV